MNIVTLYYIQKLSLPFDCFFFSFLTNLLNIYIYIQKLDLIV